MSKLTLQDLIEMEPDTIFTRGTTTDDEVGVNLVNGEGREIRWLAVRGGIHDWAIYYHWANFHSDDWIKDQGDKVHREENIKKLVPCDEEAFEMYRH